MLFRSSAWKQFQFFVFCWVLGSVAVWTCSFMKEKTHRSHCSCIQWNGSREKAATIRPLWQLWSAMAMKYLGAYLMAVLGGKEEPTAKESLGPWKGTLVSYLAPYAWGKVGISCPRISLPPEDFPSVLFLFILNGSKNHLQGNEREA